MNPFKKNYKQLSFYITAGFPEQESLVQQAIYLEKCGVDFLEIGIPFSDPLADGPTIQSSSSIALNNGMNLDLLFEQLAILNETVSIPRVLMGYFNPILRYGIDRFLKKAVECGISGLIIPDISIELYMHNYVEQFNKYLIPFIPLITNSTPIKQLKTLCENQHTGFVYFIGQQTITGKKNESEDYNFLSEELKLSCQNLPIFTGFGIKTNQDFIRACKTTDGVIIGSRLIEAIDQGHFESYVTEMIGCKHQINSVFVS